MECVATARLAVVQVALPLASATAAQPAIELPPSVKLTLPVGLDPMTVAVKVTLLPTVDGLSELDSVVVLVAALTACDMETLADPAFDASPLYVAMMACVPTVRAAVAHCAVRVLPEPDSATALQPPIDAAPAWKFTVPVGATPLT